MAELNAEFIGNGWTTRESITELIKDYNASIVKLRRMESAYAAWIEKYWGAKQAADFGAVMKAVKAFDGALHGLNDQFELVNIKKTQDKVDPEKAKETATRMAPLAQGLVGEDPRSAPKPALTTSPGLFGGKCAMPVG